MVASSIGRCRTISQKQERRAYPPSNSRLNPLTPKSAESPWPAGKTCIVAVLWPKFPTAFVEGKRSSQDGVFKNGEIKLEKDAAPSVLLSTFGGFSRIFSC